MRLPPPGVVGVLRGRIVDEVARVLAEIMKDSKGF